MATISIWPGSSSFSDTTNPTPFGFYDTDQEFQTSADQVSTWCAQRLGYPIVDIELQAVNFYTAFEEAITTYAQYVYQYEIIENMGTLEGTSTDEDLNNKYIQPNLGNSIAIAEQYGTEAGTGGNIRYKNIFYCIGIHAGFIFIIKTYKQNSYVNFEGSFLNLISFFLKYFQIQFLFESSTRSLKLQLDIFCSPH